MATVNSLRSVMEKLEDLFQKFNDYFYGGELEKPIITVSPDTTSGAYGWFTTYKAWKEVDGEEGSGYYEINICAEYLHRSTKEICTTLLHEMVHLYCKQNDIKDTSRGSIYHNKRFKEQAEAHGLEVSKDDSHGWSNSALNAIGEEFVESMELTDFGIHRAKNLIAKTSKKSSSRKYVCPMCGMSVRATKIVNIRCIDCDADMEEEV